MRTIADFKRRIVKGAKLHCVFHQKFSGRDESGKVLLEDEDRGVREIARVQSNAFTLLTHQSTGVIIESWCYYPKASEVKFIDEDTIQILEQDFRENGKQSLIPILTYKFVS